MGHPRRINVPSNVQHRTIPSKLERRYTPLQKSSFDKRVQEVNGIFEDYPELEGELELPLVDGIERNIEAYLDKIKTYVDTLKGFKSCLITASNHYSECCAISKIYQLDIRVDDTYSKLSHGTPDRYKNLLWNERRRLERIVRNGLEREDDHSESIEQVFAFKVGKNARQSQVQQSGVPQVQQEAEYEAQQEADLQAQQEAELRAQLRQLQLQPQQTQVQQTQVQQTQVQQTQVRQTQVQQGVDLEAVLLESEQLRSQRLESERMRSQLLEAQQFLQDRRPQHKNKKISLNGSKKALGSGKTLRGIKIVPTFSKPKPKTVPASPSLGRIGKNLFDTNESTTSVRDKSLNMEIDRNV